MCRNVTLISHIKTGNKWENAMNCEQLSTYDNTNSKWKNTMKRISTCQWAKARAVASVKHDLESILMRRCLKDVCMMCVVPSFILYRMMCSHCPHFEISTFRLLFNLTNPLCLLAPISPPLFLGCWHRQNLAITPLGQNPKRNYLYEFR